MSVERRPPSFRIFYYKFPRPARYLLIFLTLYRRTNSVIYDMDKIKTLSTIVIYTYIKHIGFYEKLEKNQKIKNEQIAKN